MPLVFRALHAAAEPAHLNEEWILLENTGPTDLQANGWTLAVARPGQPRARELGKLEPGFLLKPGEKVRIVTGSPGKKAQGTPPKDGEDGAKNYFLFLRERILERPGLTVRFTLKQLELARATFAPDAATGIDGQSASAP